MNRLARAILVFLALLLIGGAFFMLSVCYELIPNLIVTRPSWASDNVMLGIGSAMLLIALVLLSLGLRPSRKPANAVLKGSEFGEVLIPISAVENMVLRVIQQTQGIKDLERKVAFTGDGLVIRVKIRVMPDISLPALIGDLQSKIKEYLEEITGVVVHEVKVMVENIIIDQAVSKK